MLKYVSSFYCIFHAMLNVLAELLRFGDRNFYNDWWNASSVGQYWRNWNLPVHNYFIRHVYIPMVKRGWGKEFASATVFFISAVLHELIVAVPSHNVIQKKKKKKKKKKNPSDYISFYYCCYYFAKSQVCGVAFLAILIQIPLVTITKPLERLEGPWKSIGNCFFWLSLCLLGQPSAVLFYFYAWNMMR